MADIILHHYPASPFAEKIRLILGYKKLAWRSVLIPAVMPKPDLTSLTGGYRRTPVLQIGADIYCDTAIICDVLERLAPEPSLFPAKTLGLNQCLAQWADTDLFWAVVTYAFQPAGQQAIFSQMSQEQAVAFAEDRAKMRGNAPAMSLAEAKASLHSYLLRLEQILADEQPYLLGDEPCLADFSCYHPIWFIQNIPTINGVLQQFPQILDWLARMQAIGHHHFEKMKSAEALQVAYDAQPSVTNGKDCALLGIKIGDQVRINASDYGSDVVEGELVDVSLNHLAVRRSDERVGEVVVYFPRIGFCIKKTKNNQ